MKTTPWLAFSAALALSGSALAAPPPAPPGPTPATGAAGAIPPPPPPPSAPSPTAPAAPPDAPPTMPSLEDSLSGAAKVDYQAAKQLFDVGDFAGALIKFTSAHEATNDPRLLWNMATCEAKLHHYARAVEMVRAYVKDGGSLLSTDDRQLAEQTAHAMEPLTSTLSITTSEAGAEVYVDEQLAGKTPLDPLLEDIGVHRVRAHKPEFEDVEQEITVSGGAPVALALALRPIVHQGKISVHANPKDAIDLDGQPVGVGAWSSTVRSGGHTLRVTSDGMQPYQTEVLVQDDQERTIDVALLPEPRKGLLPAWAWIVGGTVVAGGAATGAYFLFKPSSKYEGPTGNLGPGIVQSVHVHF